MSQELVFCELLCTPPELVERATATVNNLLPRKSRDVYEHCYKQFMDWKTNKCANSFSENVVVAYFSELSIEKAPSTLWKIYSMLRSTIIIKHNINIANYAKLRAFLKRKSDGFQPKKSKTLTREEINKFINEAPDNVYLATKVKKIPVYSLFKIYNFYFKVAFIVGVMGACRKHELWQMKTNHIQDLGTAILIQVPDTKTKIERKFTITGSFCTIFKKYWALRPVNVTSNNFFLNYQKGRCTNQVIGMNKFGSMPKHIATFLKLENPEKYTGHCFRRTSATMLVDAGADITMLKRHGGWKSTTVAENYVDNSLNSRMSVANKILTEVTQTKQITSTVTSLDNLENENVTSKILGNSVPSLHFTNCNNNHITINIINKENEEK